MRINVKSSNRIACAEQFLHRVAAQVEDNLARFGGRITNVDVLIIDDEIADDKGCVIEARLSGLEPIAVRSHARTVERAVTAGTDRMERVLGDTLGTPPTPTKSSSPDDTETIDWLPEQSESD